MKPMHGEVMRVGANNQCSCCATVYGRHGSGRNKRLAHAASRAGKRLARAKAKKEISSWLD